MSTMIEKTDNSQVLDRARPDQGEVPLVSVVIPVYNRTEFVGQAIRSAFDQTHQPIEVVVVDDGSMIDVQPALESFGETVTLIRQANGGPAAARNRGMDRARGTYVLFLDDDDFLEPDAVEQLLGALRTCPQAYWAAGHYVLVDEEGVRLPTQRRFRLESGDAYPRMVQENAIGGPSVVLIRREPLQALGGFDESRAIQITEDYDLWLTLAREWPLAVTSRVVANYRCHTTQATTNWARSYECRLRVLHKQRDRARPHFEAAFQHAIARIHLEYGDSLYYHGDDWDAARAHWKTAWELGCDESRWRLLARFAKCSIPAPIHQALRRLRGAARVPFLWKRFS